MLTSFFGEEQMPKKDASFSLACSCAGNIQAVFSGGRRHEFGSDRFGNLISSAGAAWIVRIDSPSSVSPHIQLRIAQVPSAIREVLMPMPFNCVVSMVAPFFWLRHLPVLPALLPRFRSYRAKIGKFYTQNDFYHHFMKFFCEEPHFPV
jgi:hypothetical protein